jgi:Glutaredoxin-like domain (DUF836)
MLVVQYYSRTGCHLCEIMLEELLPLVRGRASIEMCDIDSRPDWREKYNTRVPVIEYAGETISGYPLDYGAIRRFLARLPEKRE